MLRRRYNATLEALFSAVAPLASDCVRTAEAERLVRALRADGWSIAPNWLEPDTWDPYGHGVCDPLLAKDMHMDRWVADWVREGYEVNRTLAVVHMEGWARRGAAYVRRLLRLLRLPEALYPWRRAEEAFAAPVFRGEARRRYSKRARPTPRRAASRRQCAPLAAATESGRRCRAAGRGRREGETPLRDRYALSSLSKREPRLQASRLWIRSAPADLREICAMEGLMLVGAQKPLSEKVALSPIRQAWGNARLRCRSSGWSRPPTRATSADGAGQRSAALALERPPRLQSCSAMAMSCASRRRRDAHATAAAAAGQQRRHAHEALLSR